MWSPYYLQYVDLYETKARWIWLTLQWLQEGLYQDYHGLLRKKYQGVVVPKGNVHQKEPKPLFILEFGAWREWHEYLWRSNWNICRMSKSRQVAHTASVNWDQFHQFIYLFLVKQHANISSYMFKPEMNWKNWDQLTLAWSCACDLSTFEHPMLSFPMSVEQQKWIPWNSTLFQGSNKIFGIWKYLKNGF